MLRWKASGGSAASACIPTPTTTTRGQYPLQASANAYHVAIDTAAMPAAAASAVDLPPPPPPERAQLQQAHLVRRRQRRLQVSAKDAIPWSPLHAQVQASIAEHDLIPPGASVLVAVSGGQVRAGARAALGAQAVCTPLTADFLVGASTWSWWGRAA